MPRRCLCVGVFQGQSFREAGKSEKRSERYSETQVRATHHIHSLISNGSHGNLPFVLQVVRGLQLGRPPSGEHRPPVHTDREYSSASVCPHASDRSHPLSCQVDGPLDNSNFDYFPEDTDSPPVEDSGWDLEF